MKERPILLSAWEVRAILAGTKTRITRPITPQPDSVIDGEPYWNVGGFRVWQHRSVADVLRKGGNTLRSPFGAPGDVLIGKETWGCREQFYRHDAPDDRDVIYGVDGEPARCHGTAWRSSTTMPRWAARIVLRVETNSAGRVQDVSEEDAKAEGVKMTPCPYPNAFHGHQCPNNFYRTAFAIEWDARYAKRGLGYDTNCWTWSATFARMAPGDGEGDAT